MTEKNAVNGSTLYLVATPIGNLADISARARKVLTEVDIIACEDTRVTGKLLAALALPTKTLVSYHEHNKFSAGERILRELRDGHSVALCSDAGTPAISDPGEELVRLCRSHGFSVTAIPGACAAIIALTLSGFSTRSFVFEGFLGDDAQKKAQRLASEERTIVLYEAPHRLERTLTILAQELGAGRRVALCRELTKLNEEVEITTIGEALSALSAKTARGEYVIVIEGATPTEGESFWAAMTVAEHVEFYTRQGVSRMDAIKLAARDRGLPKNAVYKEFL